MDRNNSGPQPAKGRQRGQEEAGGAKGGSPMLGLSSPAQRPSEKLLVLHDPFHEPLDLVLSASLFPASAVGKVAQLRQKRAPNVSLHALLDELGQEQSEEAPAVGFLTVQAVRQLPSNAAASVAKGVAEVLGFASRMAVEVELVEDQVSREAAALSSVVLLFKGQYIGRADMYHVKRSLVGECIQRSKEVLYGSISAEVHALHRDGEVRSSGLVTEDTRFVFRSRSGKIFIFVQLSKEMWDFAEDSNIYFELATNHFLKELFQRWKEHRTNHSVTIIFFSRCFYPALAARPLAGPAPSSQLPSSTMHVDSRGRQYRDFFKIILDNETKKDWLPVLSLLKKEFRNYPEHIGWCSPEQTPHSELPEQSKQPALAVNSSASEGNMLEAINLALNEFDKHYIDRDLTHTGQNILLISAGSGFFEVPANLAAITKQRMLDNSIGCDLVCVRKPPLHLVPLFRYTDYAKKAPAEVRGLTPAVASHAGGGAAQSAAKGKETVYKIPYWIYISFYSRSASRRTDQSITHALPNEIVEYMEDAREPSFVTPHRAWAACNSYLMTKFLSTSAGAAAADGRSPHRGTPVRRPPSSPEVSEHSLRSPTTPRSLATTPTESYACPSPPTASRAGSKTSPLMMTSLAHKTANRGDSSGEGKGMAYSLEEYERVANSLSQSYHEGTPLFANDLARTAAARKASHTRKRGAALWPTDMAILAQSTSSSRRWSHLFPKPLGKLTPSARNATAPNLFTDSANWESLTAPACLPLETDFFPTERELASGFMQGAYTLSLLPGEDVYQNNTAEMVQELVSQRLAQNYQLAVTQDLRQQGVHCLALGQVFHKLVYDGQANVTVKRYYHKEKVYDIPGIHYDYALWAINDNSFRKASVEIKYDNITRFNWNYVDQMICGEATDYFDAMRGWSIHFAVIPDKGAQSARPLEEEADEATHEELERERVAAFLRFTGSLLRSNRIFKREHRLEVRVVSDVATAAAGGDKSPRGSDAAALTSGSEQEGEEEDLLQSIVQRMRALDSGLEIVDRKQLLRKQRRCFVGAEAVDWVLRNVELSGEYSRAAALEVMQAMMDEGYVTHTSKRQQRFADAREFYRFIVDQNVVDIRRVALRERRQQRTEEKAASAHVPLVSLDGGRAPASLQRSTDHVDASVPNLARHGSLPALGSYKAPPKLPGVFSTADLSVLGKQQKPMFSSNKRKTMKVEVEDPAKQTDRYQWILLQYDEAFHPWCCFHIDIKWMICTGSAVKEIVSHMQRQARQAGVTIIQVPSDRDLHRHPFRSPVQILLPASLGVDRHMLLTRVKFIPFLHDGSQVVYMHRTGVAFLDVTDEGLTWSYNYTPVLQPLMADARALLQQLEDLCADLRADAEAQEDSSSDDEATPDE